MPAFGIIECEKVVQVSDKTRISAAKSFVSKGASAISTVEVEAEAAAGYVTVSGTGIQPKDWTLDWVYSTSGVKTISLRITQADATVTTFTKTLEVVTEAADLLWSDDQDLVTYEVDLLKWLPDGKASFKFVHRRSQSLILDWLDEIRIYKDDGTRIEKADLTHTEDLRKLSTMWTLENIFSSISNRPDDVFAQKATYYAEKRREAQNRGRIQADFNQNGEEDTWESADLRTVTMVRR